LEIEDGDGTLQVSLADLGTDDQILSLNVNTLELEDGGSVDLSKYLDNTDEQTLTLTGTDLAISGGNTIDISSIDTNTDEQTLSEVLTEGNDAMGSVITGLGAPVQGSDAATKDYVDNLDTDDADNDPTNEMNTRFEVIGSNLEIQDGSGTLQVSLADLGTDDQILSLNVNTLELEDGGSVDLSKYLDNTDEQTLELTGTDLAISGGNTIDISSIDTNTDEQTLSEVLTEGNDAMGSVITGLGAPVQGSDAATKDYVDNLDTDDADNDPTNEMNTRFEVIGSNLEIEDGDGTLQVSLADLGTDDQTLSLNVNTLELEDGGSVDLGKYLDNTDEQELSLSGTDLAISGGNTIDISGINTD